EASDPSRASPAATTASITAPQNSAGRVSLRSTASHAAVRGTPDAASHDDSSWVLPAPGGPVTTVSGPRTPASSRSNSRPRSIVPTAGRGGETRVLEIESGGCRSVRSSTPRIFVPVHALPLVSGNQCFEYPRASRGGQGSRHARLSPDCRVPAPDPPSCQHYSWPRPSLYTAPYP